MKKKTKKKRTENLPSLHPNTIAALVGKFTVRINKKGVVSGSVENEDLSAAYQAKNVCRELVELVDTIRKCRGVKALHDLYAESLEKLAQVSKVAVMIDDSGFPDQLNFAMRYARDPDMPRRVAVYRAWIHLTSGYTFHNHLTGETRTFENPPKDELHQLSELFFGGVIPARTIDGDLAEMKLDEFQKRSRGRPKKAG